ncbi:response regulator [Desulfomicrobium salsuginis]
MIEQRKSRVLLVDDSEFNLDVIGSVLSAAGVEVVTAGSGVEALDLLASAQTFDVVLLDVQMPRMDGRETVRRIRSDGRWPDLPVLAVTASTVEGEREKCLEAGMNDFLTKPVNFEALLESLARWTRR